MNWSYMVRSSCPKRRLQSQLVAVVAGYGLKTGPNWTLKLGKAKLKPAKHMQNTFVFLFLNLSSGGFTVAIFDPIFDLLFSHFLIILLPNSPKGAEK